MSWAWKKRIFACIHIDRVNGFNPNPLSESAKKMNKIEKNKEQEMGSKFLKDKKNFVENSKG